MRTGVEPASGLQSGGTTARRVADGLRAVAPGRPAGEPQTSATALAGGRAESAAKAVQKRRIGTSENGSQRRVATRPNEVWSYDFVSDQTADGRRLKFLCVVDEFTRECLALAVRRSFRAKDVIAVRA